LLGCFQDCFVRYLTSNDESFLSGTLPSNEPGSVPRSPPSCSPHSDPSSFPDYSAGNFSTNLPSFLESNEDGSGARHDPAWTGIRDLVRYGLEVLSYGRVVTTCDGERFGGELHPYLSADSAGPAEFGDNLRVVLGVGHHRDESMILGRCP